MPSADQVPTARISTMRGVKWLVLIARSTGSAIRAVCHPNLHITPVNCLARYRFRRKRGGVFVVLALDHDPQTIRADFVGKRNGGDLRRPPCQQCGEPRAALVP